MVKLTERHKQIAVLAAAGVMKKEIAGAEGNTISEKYPHQWPEQSEHCRG